MVFKLKIIYLCTPKFRHYAKDEDALKCEEKV
jgi:hypothetical protein